ncbi:hypothetical protein ACIQNK_20880 [Streptomyces sp. NPDC091273]|uniref:hypothetical protein n=1 Tax=Streptomyces sp. NPDC091273 TaxID=3365982 RepID=UPI003822473E
MRFKPLIITVTAATALLSLTGCGGGDNPTLGGIGGDSVATGGDNAYNGTGDGGPNEGTLENPTKNGGVNGNAPKDGTAFQKLPKAATMAAAARFVDRFTDCDPIKPITPGSSGSSTGPDEKFIKSATVIERGGCDGGRTTIYMIKDAKSFQTAFKAETAAHGGNPNGGIVVGQDFAMGSVDSDSMSALLKPQAGLLMLNCHEGFTAPSGYRKEPALVKGCVLTDYYVD